MRIRHFDALNPVCPVCKRLGHLSSLSLNVYSIREELVLSGILSCTNRNCRAEFPILQGIPILVENPTNWLTENIHLIQQCDYDNELFDKVLYRMISPDTAFAITRQQQFSYCSNHYRKEIISHDPNLKPNLPKYSIAEFLENVVPKLPNDRKPILDVGCAVGGTTFQLAKQREGLVLGLDINWPLLSVGSEINRTGILTYYNREIGNKFTKQNIRIDYDEDINKNVDFWIADVQNLPFGPNTFGCVLALNLIDCVTYPETLLNNIEFVIDIGGGACITTPYDWSTVATPYNQWLFDVDDLVKLIKSCNDKSKLADKKIIEWVVAPYDDEWSICLHSRSMMVYRINVNILSFK